VRDVVLPTLAVVLSWLCVGVVLAGCGFLARRVLLRLLPGSAAGGLATADLWIGLAALTAYLQVWSLFHGISRLAWIAPALAGLAGAATGARRLRWPRGARVSAVALALPVLGTLWLANRALAAAQDYDLGLYHLNAIEYALKYGAVPGLGNLHSRLGAGDAHLLFVAFLEHGPWAGAAPHLANGLLASLLLVEVASRYVLRRAALPPGSFTRRLALLLVPAAVAVVGVGSAYRLSSPNLDLAAFVLLAVGALYLAECFEYGFRPAAALTSTASFALVAVTRPLYWLATALAIGALAVAARRFRLVAVACALPCMLLLGWVARQAVLSGYPFFPTTVGGLPVDWRVPASVVHSQNRVTDAWARWPGKGPGQVFGSWHWLSVWWHRRVRDFDVVAPLTLLASLVPSLLATSRDRDRRTAPMLAVLVPALAVLLVWFFVVPDPRFALAPIWLVPVALVAWALPAAADRPPAAFLVAAALVAGGFVALGVLHLEWLILAAVDAWALAAVALRLFGSRRLQGLLAQTALVSLALVPIGIVADRGAFDVVVSDQGGPLGTPPEPMPSLVPFTTRSGLQLSQPAGGGDQCWGVILCAPHPNGDLRLRGRDVDQGFTLQH
jgi:hypothetical protein